MSEPCARCAWHPWETVVWIPCGIAIIILAFTVLLNLTTPAKKSRYCPRGGCPAPAETR